MGADKLPKFEKVGPNVRYEGRQLIVDALEADSSDLRTHPAEAAACRDVTVEPTVTPFAVVVSDVANRPNPYAVDTVIRMLHDYVTSDRLKMYIDEQEDAVNIVRFLRTLIVCSGKLTGEGVTADSTFRRETYNEDGENPCHRLWLGGVDLATVDNSGRQAQRVYRLIHDRTLGELFAGVNVSRDRCGEDGLSSKTDWANVGKSIDDTINKKSEPRGLKFATRPDDELLYCFLAPCPLS